MEDIVEVATFGTTFEAKAAAAHLEAENIRSSVLTDNAGGTIPSMSMLDGGVRLVVAGQDAEEALQILDQIFTDTDAADETSNA